MIHLSLLSLVTFNIIKEKAMEDLIVALSQTYEKLLASNKVFLIKRLFNMKMGERGGVAKHLNKFNTVTCYLSVVGINFKDEVRTLVL